MLPRATENAEPYRGSPTPGLNTTLLQASFHIRLRDKSCGRPYWWAGTCWFDLLHQYTNRY